MPHTQAVFLAVDRTLEALAPRGSRKCRKLTHRVDDVASDESGAPQVLKFGFVDDNLRRVLRVRCAICPKRCRNPLAPVMMQAAAE